MTLSNSGATVERVRGVLQGVSGRCDWDLAPGAAAQEYKLVGPVRSGTGSLVVRLLHMTPGGTEGVLLDNVRVRRVSDVSSGCSPSVTTIVSSAVVGGGRRRCVCEFERQCGRDGSDI